MALGYFQVGRAVPSTPWELVTNATPLTQAVLVLLALLSLLSWAVMFAKWREYRRVARAGREFMGPFEHATNLEQARAIAARAPAGPHARVFERGMEFLGEMKPSSLYAGDTTPLSGSQVEALRLVLDAAASREREVLARYVPTLAVIGSVSPLIGLLGTVLGVIDAFLGIAREGAGNIGAVAPGVAEALIATAAALSVAIPATFGYNLFASRLNRVDAELEGLGTEVIALMVREGQV